MTLSEALEEYERLLYAPVTPESYRKGLKELREGTDKMNIAYNPICDNDEQEGDVWP